MVWHEIEYIERSLLTRPPERTIAADKFDNVSLNYLSVTLENGKPTLHARPEELSSLPILT